MTYNKRKGIIYNRKDGVMLLFWKPQPKKYGVKMTCDKCGWMITGRLRSLKEPKQEYHSY
jgi:hypothetical protein